MRAEETATGKVRVILEAGESLTIGDGAFARTVTGPITYEEVPVPGLPLQAALEAAGVAIAPFVVDLVDYANKKQMALALGGFAAVIGGKPVPFATTVEGLTMMNGKVSRLSQANPPTSINWQVGPTDFVSIAAKDFLAAAVKVGDFIQATFDALPAVFSAIAAGTIATTTEVDQATWPANVG